MNPLPTSSRTELCRIARRAMTERGLLPDFSPAALAQTAAIDNDDSRDLDQLTVAEALTGGAVRRIRVAYRRQRHV